MSVTLDNLEQIGLLTLDDVLHFYTKHSAQACFRRYEDGNVA